MDPLEEGHVDRLAAAREIVRTYPLPEALRQYLGPDGFTYHDGAWCRSHQGELTSDVLAASLHYSVDLALTPNDDEFAVELGASKYRGLPHLPPGFEWPAGQFFVLQLNLAEFHEHDRYDVFPAEGLISIFMSTMEDDVTVVHYAGPFDELRVTDYPDASVLPERYYLDRFLADSALVTFEPICSFELDIMWHDLQALLPQDLVDQVTATIGAPLVEDGSGGVFGRPSFWQGEDMWNETIEEFDDRPEDAVMLFQDEIGEATMHVWVAGADAAARNYSDCTLTSSST
jgi:hypothetical protein